MGFGVDGQVQYSLSGFGSSIAVESLSVDEDARITIQLVSAKKRWTLRYLNGGSLDDSFGSKGKKTESLPEGYQFSNAVFDAKGQSIVVGKKVGKYTSDFLVQRYLSSTGGTSQNSRP